MKYQINAEIIADSKNEFGQRITTFVLNYPRIIHAEMMTHRVFSRNAASSRAIPVEKMISQIEDNPFVPLAFQKNHSGMQGTEYLTGKDYETARDLWLMSRDSAVISAKEMVDHGITKQLINRTLEPYQWYQAIFTATEWENFFKLRCPQYYTPVSGEEFFARSWKELQSWHSNPKNEEILENADVLFKLQHNKGQGEIHIMALAEAMWDAMNESEPKQLKAGEWHIPFGDNIDTLSITLDKFGLSGVGSEKGNAYQQEAKVKIATARCARISYLNFEGKDDYEADIKLHDNLLKSGHYSPFEHCARAMSNEEYQTHVKGFYPLFDNTTEFDSYSLNKSNTLGWCRNFRGFIQYRAIVE